MIILAWYYTIADIVILLQCFYYRGFTLSDQPKGLSDPSNEEADERTTLVASNPSTSVTATETGSSYGSIQPQPSSRRSSGTIRESITTALHNDGTHFSPAVPLHATRDEAALKTQSPVQKKSSLIKSILFNSAAILVVCLAGILGWWLSLPSASHSSSHRNNRHIKQTSDDLSFNVWGQIFGYVCAVLYLGSRVPQLLLNFRRKSTEGVSMLFFLFAVLGNLTYVISILAFQSPCKQFEEGCANGEASRQYVRSILINASWLLGSGGTLLLDSAVFVQWYLYRNNEETIETGAN